MKMVEFARANPGRWITYTASEGDQFKSSSSLLTLAKQGRGGFSHGFEAFTRDGQLYVRYTGQAKK